MLVGRLETLSKTEQRPRRTDHYLPTNTLASWGIFSTFLTLDASGLLVMVVVELTPSARAISRVWGEGGGEEGRVSKRVPQVRAGFGGIRMLEKIGKVEDFWCGVCAEEMVEEEEEMHNQNALSKQEPNFAGRRAVRTVNRFSPARYSNVFGIILNLCTSHTGGVPIASKGEDSGVICSRTLFRTQIQYPGGWSTFHDGRRVQFVCVLTRANDLCFLSGR